MAFLFTFYPPDQFKLCESNACIDQETQTDNKKQEHSQIQITGRSVRSFKFMPDQDSPQGRNQCCTLPQAVRNGGSGFFRSNHTE